MNEEKEKPKLKRYLVEYRRQGESYTRSEVIEADSEEAVKLIVLERMKPEPLPAETPPVVYPVIELLNENPLAGIVQAGIKAALDAVAKYDLEGFKYRDVQVNQTRDPTRFCARFLVNMDNNKIEERMRKTFTLVEDIICSDEGMQPEYDKHFPTPDGFHEFVCIVRVSGRLRVPPLNFAVGMPYTLRHVMTWGPDAEAVYYDQTGKDDIDEATEEELLALEAGGFAWLQLVIDELGGEAYTDHRELCEDGYKYVGMEQKVSLTTATLDATDQKE